MLKSFSDIFSHVHSTQCLKCETPTVFTKTQIQIILTIDGYASIVLVDWEKGKKNLLDNNREILIISYKRI